MTKVTIDRMGALKMKVRKPTFSPKIMGMRDNEMKPVFSNPMKFNFITKNVTLHVELIIKVHQINS